MRLRFLGGVMRTLQVDLGDRSYPIHIGSGLLAARELIAPHVAGQQVAIVTNETVEPLYLQRLIDTLDGFTVLPIVLPDGEEFKNWEVLQRIFDALLEARHDRKTTLIALGGGVIGDMTGFAAAQLSAWGRLYSDSDHAVVSSRFVGRRQDRDQSPRLARIMIGAFYQPKAVIIDIATLKTLPERELSAGLAEVIKYGLICDEPFLAWLEQHMAGLLALDEALLSEAIERSCAAKARVVSADEREGGVRAILNLGHTFGHAIETHQGYGVWLHGEAVSAGTVMALEMSCQLGSITQEQRDRAVRLLRSARLPIVPPEDMTPADFARHMAVDKKVLNGKLRLVLLSALGEAVVTGDFPRAVLDSVLAADYSRIAAQI